MKWTDIPIPFFEDNRAFLLPFLTLHEHGTWVEDELFGPLLCRIHVETPVAIYEDKTLSILADSTSKSITCWSANRQFKPATSICSHKPDIQVSAQYTGDDEWEVFGKIRTGFLKSKAGQSLKQRLMVAQLKEQKPHDDTGRIIGTILKI